MQLERLKQRLRNDEGEKLKLYKCPANKLTIGIGHNIEEKGIKKEVSELIFKLDVEEVIEELAPALKNKFSIDFESLSDVRQEVLLNMAFQLGVPGLMKFKNTFSILSHAINLDSQSVLDNDHYERVSLEMLDSLWAKQTPQRAKRLSYAMKHNKFKK